MYRTSIEAHSSKIDRLKNINFHDRIREMYVTSSTKINNLPKIIFVYTVVEIIIIFITSIYL